MTSTNKDITILRKGFGFVSAMLTALFIAGVLAGGVLVPLLIFVIGDDFGETESRQVTLGIAVVSAVIATPVTIWVIARVDQLFNPLARGPLTDPVSCYLAVVDPNSPDVNSASLMAASAWLCLGPRRHFASWWPVWITEILEEGGGFDTGYMFATQQDFERLQRTAERQSRRLKWFWRRRAEIGLLQNQARQIVSAVERAKTEQKYLLFVYGTQEEIEQFCPSATQICDV